MRNIFRELFEKNYLKKQEKILLDNIDLIKPSTENHELKCPKIIYKNIITFMFEDNSMYSYKYPVESPKNKIEPWKDFISWYYRNKESESFLFEYDNGLLLIKRDKLKMFKIEIQKTIE